ncbi:phage protein [Achromobacter ruhlandii]|uniref:phage protein n=1 Tax=Achromobacter ruhlandii TaxID=72557 RepID=UPI0020C48B8F|nr:hypothetical protein [Achromobacter ruhlandii]MCZ8435123.1 hypothetical protein [Achromobacter ruhlandii]MDC6087231.1 hypothetical protein [Achromobacter ruhlandii]MDC6153104.1 hypothetical protein [Achromobacter ruhlandii]MDD7982143.1 hypothetical protein [Achromobacter ruhlandii]WIW04695.1 hypothetical protein PPH40_008705 [Achromobacter ruhlandii]
MANTTVPIDPSGLIGIFKIDKDDLKDLKQAIGDSRKQSLADALAVFAGRAKSVVDFAENKIAQFEQGYFAAKLGGTSGRDMRALEAVAQDFGVSVEAMRNSTQALHRNVRDDPRIAALLEQLHISSSDGAGAQRNSADLVLELSDALKRMDPAQARATGQSLGLDPGVMEALRDPGFGQRLSAQRDTQENSTVEAAGERAHQLMGTIRELSGSVNAMFAQALLTMGPKLQETLDGISAWFKENGQTAGKRLGEVGNFVLSIMSLLGPVISLITWLDGLTGGLSSQLLVLVGGFLMLVGGGVVGALMGLVSRLGGMRSIIGGLGTQLASLPGRISGVVSRAWTATSNFVGGVFGRMTSMGRTAVTQMSNMASAVWSWMGNMAARGGALVVDSVKAAGATALQWGQSLWANTATIKVMNASRETASLVQREFTRVVLQAGYEGNYGVIFHGNVVRAKWGGSGDTETVLEITAADGDKAYNFAVVNATVPKGSDRADKVRLLCSAMNPYGVRQGYVPDLGGKKSIRGAVMSGMVRDYLQDVCGSANTLWSIQDGKVVVVPETAYVPGSVPVLSHDSGLVGMPEQTEKGIKLRMLLNPSIRVGGLVNLDNSRIAEYGFQARSERKDANEIDRAEQRRISGDGYYYVMEVEHRGNTRDDEWYTEVLCLATDATLFPGDLGRAGAEGDAAKPAAVVK